MADHASTQRRKGKGRTRRVARLALLAGALAIIAACAKVAGIDGLEIGECKGGGACSAEAGTGEDGPFNQDETGPTPDGDVPFDGSTLPCPGNHGPTMVRVGTAANNFCIDSTEVTVGQYRAFTDAKGTDVSGQPPQCAWNATYAAASGGTDEIPIAGVDWCDAHAFCAWAGKRLCGKHAAGKFVGSVGSTELGDFNTHEWLLACSDLGQLRYPYGSLQRADRVQHRRERCRSYARREVEGHMPGRLSRCLRHGRQRLGVVRRPVPASRRRRQTPATEDPRSSSAS